MTVTGAADFKTIIIVLCNNAQLSVNYVLHGEISTYFSHLGRSDLQYIRNQLVLLEFLLYRHCLSIARTGESSMQMLSSEEWLRGVTALLH